MYRIFKWKKVVIKESSFDEVKKIEEARKILKTHKIEINNIEYSFHLSKIYAFKNNKIYWKDFAPRNIWVDTENKRINFFDFEKGIVTNTNDKEYLQIWKNKFAQI